MRQNSSEESKLPILDLSYPELEGFLKERGQAAFRSKQVFGWVYRDMVTDFQRMTNVAKALRDELTRDAEIQAVEPVIEVTSDDELTRKVLLRLRDGALVETVLMIYPARNNSRARRTVCISSQSGCGMGCAFCATGKGGLTRNLTSGEISDQVLHFARQLAARGEAVTNVVVMGQGEPLVNYGEVWKSITTLNSPYGFSLGARHFTISTVGIVPRIREMARTNLQVGLAVSLHAPNDELRAKLLPINAKYPIRDLMAVCKDYTETTNRRVTFEYSLIEGVNDRLEHARELAVLIKGMLCHVNLIALNPVEGLPYRPSSPRRVAAFEAELQRHNIATTVRASRGTHIDAACGQLAGRASSR